MPVKLSNNRVVYDSYIYQFETQADADAFCECLRHASLDHCEAQAAPHTKGPAQPVADGQTKRQSDL